MLWLRSIFTTYFLCLFFLFSFFLVCFFCCHWKARLCSFPGSGDLSPAACSKNRYRTQTICSPERPRRHLCANGPLLLNSFLYLKKKKKNNSMSWATRWCMWFYFLFFFHHALVYKCGDITDEIQRYGDNCHRQSELWYKEFTVAQFDH